MIERLAQIVGEKGLITDAGDMTPYLTEWRDKWVGKAHAVVRPANTEQVAAVVKLCAETGTAIVPQAGNTSLVGGSVPDETGDQIVLSLNRMKAIREIDTDGMTLTAEAGCVLFDVQGAAEEAHCLFPLSLASEGSAQIGGLLSTNAGGTNVLRYGMARDLCLGLEVVLPNGEILPMLRSLRKDNTGYDLKQLFIGAEGTLGVITAATLKLFPQPKQLELAFLAVASVQDAVALLSRARSALGDQLSGFEFMSRFGLDLVIAHKNGTDPFADPHDWYVLIQTDSPRPGGDVRSALEHFLADALKAGLVQDGVVAQSTTQAAQLWALRHNLSEAQKGAGGSIKHDVSVPISHVPALIRRASEAAWGLIPGARPCPFGHLGDGNVHFNISQPDGADRDNFLARWDEVSDRVHAIVHDLGGSISAEHGLGQLKREEITRYKSAAEITLMRTLKKTLDPQNILNPGRVV